MRFFTAVLASALALSADLGAVQVLPFGQFKARDGRPGPGKHWTLTDAQGAKIAAALNAVAARTPVVIDYEHQTLLTAQNGKPAPAAGWMKSFEWRAGQGLWATVEWTAAAKTAIEAREYLYFSPVIEFDQAGAVTGVQLGALVNHPGLLGMEAAVAQLGTQFTTPQEQQHMDLVAALCALFAMAATSTPEQVLAHATDMKAKVDQVAALKAKLGLDDKADLAAIMTKVEELSTAALKSNTADPATLAAMQALQTQVAALTTQINERSLTELVDSAIKAHKLLPAQRDWAVGLGKMDMAALKTYVETAQPIPGLGGQSDGAGHEGGDAAALSATGAGVLTAFGLTKEQFDKAKA